MEVRESDLLGGYYASSSAEDLLRFENLGLDGIGDRGIDRVLDAIEAALKTEPREDHRHRIEHCCYVPPSIQKRLKALGVIDASANGFLHANDY